LIALANRRPWQLDGKSELLRDGQAGDDAFFSVRGHGYAEVLLADVADMIGPKSNGGEWTFAPFNVPWREAFRTRRVAPKAAPIPTQTAYQRGAPLSRLGSSQPAIRS
jgi:hypothetical protein